MTRCPVLILGGGINGAALARELVLNGIGTWIVDVADLASGATSGSSRLIHGGLRYLEYGELDLVKESLAERTRLLRLAPQFVKPLKLWVPASTRFGGAVGAAGRFFGWSWWPQPPAKGRGAWLVRAGLAMYDAYARDPTLPTHRAMRSAAATVDINRDKYPWACSYYDAQVEFPERLVVAMLEDARALAAVQGCDFRVLTHHEARLAGDLVEIRPTSSAEGRDVLDLECSAIINATGAWVDRTLARLSIAHERLIGGTRGSHIFTFRSELREALAGQGVYVEASDGRPIFITPLVDAVLIGTTDQPFDGPPESAVATQAEIDYLLSAANAVFPQVALVRGDVAFHCCAVRPLPYVSAATPAAVTRRHALVEHPDTAVPLFSVVGGKLTTMRSLAETTATVIIERLGRTVSANSRQRTIPGGENWPGDHAALAEAQRMTADQTTHSTESVAAAWSLLGGRAPEVLAADDDHTLLDGTVLPRSLARASIEREWAATLSDLVERRLMLLYHQRLTRTCLEQLAQLLVAAGHLQPAQKDAAVAAEIESLGTRHGKQVE